MNRIVSRFLAVPVAVALVLNFAGDVLAKGAKQKYVYKFDMGEKVRYKVAINGKETMKTGDDEQSAPIGVKIELEQGCLHVTKEGNIDLQVLIQSAKTKGEKGESMDLADQIGKTVYMTMTPQGDVLGMTSYDKNFDPNGLSIGFPDRAIGIGDSWDQNVKAGPRIPIPINAKYTLSGFKTFKGRECAVIDEKIETPESEAKNGIVAKATGQLLFDAKAGKIVKNTVKTHMNMRNRLKNDDPKFGPAEKIVDQVIDLETDMELL